LFLHPNDHPYDSDLVEIASDSRITAFYNKPHDDGYYRNLVNAALFILSPSILQYIVKGAKSHFEKDIFPAALLAGAGLYGYVSLEYIKDMGTPDRYEKVCADVASGKVARLNIRNKRPAVFLDRDGVINREVDLLSSVEQMELITGAADAIKEINRSGYLAVVVSNQPVIARNLCTFEELRRIHDKMETLLGQEGAYLDAIYFCPHHPDGGYPEERAEYKIVCDCRKPKPGMLFLAAKDLNIDLRASYMIGDRTTDIEAGEAAGVKQAVLIPANVENALWDTIKLLMK
jgi:histidinol-phosphate phosphatase family protein